MKKVQSYIVWGILLSVGALLGFGATSTFANRAPYHTKDRTISACKSDKYDILRVVDREGCKRDEHKIKWDGSQTAVVRIENAPEIEEFPFEYNLGRSRNVVRVDKILADGVQFGGNNFCVELPFVPLFATDKDTGHIIANLERGENLEGLCGQGTDYEAAIDGNSSGSWFFSE